MKNSIPQILQSGVLKASSDYCQWSRGKSLFDQGIEAIMEVYAAKAIYERFSESNILVELQYDTKGINFLRANCPEEFRHGRIDLFADGGSNEGLFLVEFKRYLNPSSIRHDIARLALIATAAKLSDQRCTGFLTGPMYRERDSQYSFKDNYDANLAAARNAWPDHVIKSYVGDDEALPLSENYETKYVNHLSIVVEVAAQ